MNCAGSFIKKIWKMKKTMTKGRRAWETSRKTWPKPSKTTDRSSHKHPQEHNGDDRPCGSQADQLKLLAREERPPRTETVPTLRPG